MDFDKVVESLKNVLERYFSTNVPWDSVCQALLETLSQHPFGATQTIILSEIDKNVHDQNRMIQISRGANLLKATADAVCEVSVKEIEEIPGTFTYLLQVEVDGEIDNARMFLHQDFNPFVKRLDYGIQKSRRLRLTNVRTVMLDEKSTIGILPTHSLALLLDPVQDQLLQLFSSTVETFLRNTQTLSPKSSVLLTVERVGIVGAVSVLQASQKTERGGFGATQHTLPAAQRQSTTGVTVFGHLVSNPNVQVTVVFPESFVSLTRLFGKGDMIGLENVEQVISLSGDMCIFSPLSTVGAATLTAESGEREHQRFAFCVSKATLLSVVPKEATQGLASLAGNTTSSFSRTVLGAVSAPAKRLNLLLKILTVHYSETGQIVGFLVADRTHSCVLDVAALTTPTTLRPVPLDLTANLPGHILFVSGATASLVEDNPEQFSLIMKPPDSGAAMSSKDSAIVNVSLLKGILTTPEVFPTVHLARALRLSTAFFPIHLVRGQLRQIHTPHPPPTSDTGCGGGAVELIHTPCLSPITHNTQAHYICKRCGFLLPVERNISAHPQISARFLPAHALLCDATATLPVTLSPQAVQDIATVSAFQFFRMSASERAAVFRGLGGSDRIVALSQISDDPLQYRVDVVAEIPRSALLAAHLGRPSTLT